MLLLLCAAMADMSVRVDEKPTEPSKSAIKKVIKSETGLPKTKA